MGENVPLNDSPYGLPHLIDFDIEVTKKGKAFAENQRIIERVAITGLQAMISHWTTC